MTIEAKIVADSVSLSNIRLTTYELTYPRWIHAEFMTHRLFSRNAASSRAVPVKEAIRLIRENPALPVHWGKNQPGMSAREELEGDERANVEKAWRETSNYIASTCEVLQELGLHKQVANRIGEPFTHIRVVCTATEYDNFFWLRRHPDAQPEIQALAEEMWKARELNDPVRLDRGDWHLPYFGDGYWLAHRADVLPTLEDARSISASCCAQVSYRRLDDSLEKALAIFERLASSMPPHLSPFEHQATPMPILNACIPITDVQGWATHQDVTGDFWSGNFRGWTQYRQLFMADKNLKAMTSTPLSE